MAGGGQDPSDWLQGFFLNDQATSRYAQDPSHDLQANAVFAEAARVAHQEHEAYLQFQRNASQSQSQQAFHEDSALWSPFEDTYRENLIQSQIPHVSPYGKQPCDAPDQQDRFVKPSDINPWDPPRPIMRSLSSSGNAHTPATRPAIEQQRQPYTHHRPANQGRPRTPHRHSKQLQAANSPSDNERNQLGSAGGRSESIQSKYPRYDQGTSVAQRTIEHPPPDPEHSVTTKTSHLASSADKSQTQNSKSSPAPSANPRPSVGGMARLALSPTSGLPLVHEANPRPTFDGIARVPPSPTSGLPGVRKSSAALNNITSNTITSSIETDPRPPAVTSAAAHSSHAAGNAAHHHPPFSTGPPTSSVSGTPTSSFYGSRVVPPRNDSGSQKHTALPASAASNFDQGQVHGRSSASNSEHTNPRSNAHLPPAVASTQFRFRVKEFIYQGHPQSSQPSPPFSSHLAPARSQVASTPALPLAASRHQQNPVARPWNDLSHAPHPAVQKTPYQQPTPNGDMPEAQVIPTKRRFGEDSNSAVEPDPRTFAVSKFPRQPSSRKHISHRKDLAQPLRVENALVKENYDPATIARDILVSSGKHPQRLRLNEHLEPLLKNTMVGITTDLDSVRWDLLDPRDPSHRPLLPTRSAVANRDESVTSPRAASIQPEPSSLPRPSPPSHAHPPLSSSTVSLPRHPSLPIPPVRTPALTYQPTPPAKPSTPTKPPTSKQLQETPSLPSHKLSNPQKAPPPSPSPRSQHHPQPQVVIASPTKMPRGRRAVGRPSNGDHGSAALSPKSTPQYQVFPCKWFGCQSELHNLESLQSHLLKVHIPHHLTCGWAACENTTPMTAADHWGHVLTAHVRPLAWTLGDGPKVSPHGEQIDLLAQDSPMRDACI